MTVRIYIIPYDLSNVQGRLRTRKEAIVSPARKYLQRLLTKISQNIESWNGNGIGTGLSPFFPDSEDRRTLADIYSDLPSPQVNPLQGFHNISSRLLNSTDTLDGLGLRSTLYSYQRQSIATMLHKELDTSDDPDPLFITVHTLDSRPFYIQPGILCEELGTGKTVMVLGLILATQKQLPIPEPSIIDDRPVLTPFSFRYSPSKECVIARKRFYGKHEPTTRASFPTLVELLTERCRTHPTESQYLDDLEREDQIQGLPLGDMIQANVPFYYHYPADSYLTMRGRVHRNKTSPGPKKMCLSHATLIVVPTNLLGQWDREIIKHCEVPLRVLVLRSKTPMPTVQQLATDYDVGLTFRAVTLSDYDTQIILTTYIRFSAEAKESDTSKLHHWTPCKCPEISSAIRIPRCSCQTHGVSPFLQIRWKRLVIDEGHVSSTLSTNLVPFAKLLSVERRWIITGTPTTNLLGLSFGSSSSEEMQIDVTPFSGTPPPSNATLDGQPETHQTSSLTTKRIWTKYDREDLHKLGNMISHFIAVPQFQADFKLVATHVIEPLLDPNGPRPGSIQVLNQVMQSVMIRHRIEDVEKDVVLPPITQEAILLDLEPCAAKSFNALQAIITINAVDSERRHQDYMFHPRNAEYLQETVRNMSQILFWHIDEEFYNATQLLADSDEIMGNAIRRNVSDQDKEALKEAFRHLQAAMDDPAWVDMQKHEDVPYRVFNVDPAVFEAWTRMQRYSEDNPSRYMHADRLMTLRDIVNRRPLISTEVIIKHAEKVSREDAIIRSEYEKLLSKKSKGTKRPKSMEEHTADNFAKKASSADTLKEMQKEFDASIARLNLDEDEIVPPASLQSSPNQLASSALLSQSAYSKIRVGSSGSAKLNYILDEVLKYSSKEKFLIFSDSPLSLAHIAEGLELARVKFLRFTTQITPQIREQLVLTFETSELYRVFLMELRHSARGLNLVSASRIIFCEPVWQADVESQAIKRAHRIGQTKSISVKTLAIRGTSEENMVSRRSMLRSTQGKLPKPIEESGMRHFIANPKFLNDPPTNLPRIDIPLFHIPQPSHSSPSKPLILKIPARSPQSKVGNNAPETPSKPALPTRRVFVEGPLDEDLSPPTKKKKTIHFAID
ncbi:hypothetical protein CVT24_006812 [Panaeolus cyanescens]|uniref:Helicase C-terminal domain-containing protein n=1 Tax=Panaeolus cyanescens TaxID=181874 RepID=A0A409VEC8_9AGAR|nr:hypothetical protein CVT24_006812 [Panaeolus cyanescens]